ncbi:MAG: hypothetical protein J2P18_07715 [Nocardia sp.]|nr:hypothetical protein [Nocardia sp.]
MVHTTPPRPVDLAEVFPELAPLARTVTRLHPRPGTPTVRDSSVGGPLLWPADEPWPLCDDDHDDDGHIRLVPLADLRLARARSLPKSTTVATYRQMQGVRIYSDDEWAAIERLEQGVGLPAGPVPMLPVAQLYARDVPDLHPPADADLLQVLWCPFENISAMPETELIWRNSAEVTDPLRRPPEPLVLHADENYLPVPCTVDPEQVLEYPSANELDGELFDQVEDWTLHQIPEVSIGRLRPNDRPYHNLAIAPGWKIGGGIRWGLDGPSPQPCRVCGTETEPLLTLATYEWGDEHWVPVEDRDGSPYNAARNPVGIRIGRGHNMIINICPASPDHPHVQLMQ